MTFETQKVGYPTLIRESTSPPEPLAIGVQGGLGFVRRPDPRCGGDDTTPLHIADDAGETIVPLVWTRRRARWATSVATINLERTPAALLLSVDDSSRWVDLWVDAADHPAAWAQAGAALFRLAPPDVSGAPCFRIAAATWGRRRPHAPPQDARARPGALVVTPVWDSPTGPTSVDIDFVVIGRTWVEESEVRAGVDRANAILDGTGAPRLELRSIGHQPGRARARYFGRSHAALAAEPLAATGVQVVLIKRFRRSAFIGNSPLPAPSPAARGDRNLVIAAYDHLSDDRTAVSGDLLGDTIVHELGHALGLPHTSESDGTAHDSFASTAECPPSRDLDGDGEVSSAECKGLGGENVMFWYSEAGEDATLTPEQVETMRVHPRVRSR
ncbi:MAG: hypothetical protein H6697_10100 [Myxococcales bacterium]|nr:hypothetical protein [Myxococcales bacterium]